MPPGRESFFNSMLVLKDENGDKLFNVLQVKMACDVCIKSGKASECRHVSVLPPWKADRLSFVKLLYGDREDLLKRESLGLSAMDPNSIFKEEWVERAWGKQSRPRPRVIFVGYDPCGGGESEWGLVSVCLEGGHLHLLGAEAMRGESAPAVLEAILQHILRLRGVWGKVPVVFVPESNLGLEAAHAHHYLKQRLPSYRCVSEKRVGVCTTHARKVLMAKGLECLFLKDAVSLSEKFVSGKGALKKLKAQLLNYKKTRNDMRSGRSTLVLTGKDTGNDDLAMALQIVSFWAEKCLTGAASYV